MKRLFARIFGWTLVWTRDFDGEVRLRKVTISPWKEHRVWGILSRGILVKDGTITHNTYMKNWKPANKKAEELFK